MEASKDFVSLAHSVMKVYTRKLEYMDFKEFDSIPNNSEELSEKLDMELRVQIMGEMKEYAEELLTNSGMENIVRNLVRPIYDVDERNRKLEEFKNEVVSLSQNETIINGSAQYEMPQLTHLYKEAKWRSLWERITKTNKNDVKKFHEALREKTFEDCKDVFWEVLQSYVNRLILKYS